MTLYLLKGYLDQAATTLADAQALLLALANPSTAANAATISRVSDRLETLCQGDTGEPLTISSIDDTAGTISAWVTDASTTLALGLGDPDPASAYTYASTTSFSISGSTRTGTLALNTTALRDALGATTGLPARLFRVASPRRFTLHLRKTTSSVTVTVALLGLSILPGVITATPSTLTATDYVSVTSARVGYVINLGAVTSLTGGGATTLDGQTAGLTDFPVGCIVCTSDSNIGRWWKLLGTYIAATDLATGLVKPVNSDATTNAVHWKLI